MGGIRAGQKVARKNDDIKKKKKKETKKQWKGIENKIEEEG